MRLIAIDTTGSLTVVIGEPGGRGRECSPCGGPAPEPPVPSAAARRCPVAGAPEDSRRATLGIR